MERDIAEVDMLARLLQEETVRMVKRQIILTTPILTMVIGRQIHMLRLMPL